MINVRKQNIGNINDSKVIIINGDVTIDKLVYKDIKTTFIDILRTDFERYSAIAIEKAKFEVENCIKSILEKLQKEQQVHLTERFQTLSIQSFLHDTLIGYITTEDENFKEFIIDVLIDRLKSQNFSTEKSILNDAIKLIPNLNTSTSALIALMMLRHQMTNVSISFLLENHFKQLSPIIDIASSISNIDVEYIIQNGCTKTISGIYPIDTFENHLLKQYDLFFRKKGDKSVLDLFKAAHPEIMYEVNDMGTCMFCINRDEENYWYFGDVNSKLFYDRLRSRGQKFLIPLIEELKEKTPPFTATEVRDYFCNLNNNWEQVFNLLNSSTLIKLDLSIVGMYLGSKIISKYTKCSSLSISNLNNIISL